MAKQETKFTVSINQPTQAQIRALFPNLARLQDDLEALGCKVNIQVESVHLEVVEVDPSISESEDKTT